MKDRVGSWLVLFVLLFGITAFLDAQTEEQRYRRRVVWKPVEHIWRYAVEIQKSENGNYRGFLYEYTAVTYLEVSLPLGEYRFRIIPHDILDRPVEGTQWVYFSVRYRPAANAKDSGKDNNVKEDRIEILEITENGEQLTERGGESEDPGEFITKRINSTRFNTFGGSIGSSFIDPMIIASIQGTFSPLSFLYIELGCDFGFVSIMEDVEDFYSIYPFAHLGLFFPFREKGGFFFGVGGGYFIGNYIFSTGEVDFNYWGFDITAGINLFNFLNIAYTLKTDFSSASNKVSIGYVYRFYSSEEIITLKPKAAEDDEEQKQNEKINPPLFDTIGVSIGTSLADPLLIATLNITFSPVRSGSFRNLFFEIGWDAGFISVYDDTEYFYSLNPFLNIGCFFPFENNGGFFISAGAGYLYGYYKYSYGDMNLYFVPANFSAGINLFDCFNITYTLKTDFSMVSHKIAVGIIYRFK